MKKILITTFFLMSFSLNAKGSVQEHSKLQGGYEVYYNALSTSFLAPEVAKNYQIGRSKSRGFVNIAVLKQNENKLSTPVEANIAIKAENFYGQNKEVTLKKISENDGAIYYIGTFSVSNRETIIFKAQVRPHNSDASIDIKFEQEFFTD